MAARPLPAEWWIALVAVDDVILLDAGRVRAVVILAPARTIGDTNRDEIMEHVIFRLVDGRWLIESWPVS